MKKMSTRQKIALIISGLFLFVVLVEMGIRIGGFIFLSLQEYRNRISIRQKGVYRIMCLGESTTFNAWPRPLEEVLNQRDIGIKFSVIDKGMPGANTEIIVSQLEDNLNKYTPDMVITMMGANEELYWKDVIAYEDNPVKKTTIFLRSFRIYKLVKLLQLHIVNKAREIGIYKPKDKREDIPIKINELVQPIHFKEQEKMLKKAIEIDPGNDGAYIELGWWYYMCTRNYDKVEEMFKKAIEINPGNDMAYVGLGRCYRDQGNLHKSEEMYKKAIEMNPGNDEAYVRLGRYYYLYTRNYDKAEEMYKKAIEINPENALAYTGLGQCYKFQKKYDKSKEMFKKAIEISPEDDRTYTGLGWGYSGQGKDDKYEAIFKKIIEIDPENDKAYTILAHYYNELGKYKLAEEYFKKANRLRLHYYNPITRNNYQRLKEILNQRGIKLLYVQYPVRSVESLKKMFDDAEGIIFVDNEKVFKEAIKQTSYDEYFYDMFGGDFGHCTLKGNRLLAENIADVILKECFNK